MIKIRRFSHLIVLRIRLKTKIKKSTKQQVVSIETKTITKTVYESISLEKKIVPTKTEAQPVSILSFYQTLKINFKLKFKIIGKLGIKMIKDIVEFEDFNKLY